MSNTDAVSTDNWPAKRRVTLVGAVVNLLLAAGKIAAGIVGHSQALIADGVHSLSDLLSDALVLVAASWGSREADANHPYGHARIETAATILIGILLLMVAGGFVYDSVVRLLNPHTLLLPGWIALVVALISIAAKEAIFHYTQRVAQRTASPLIAANAWHHRSDALSSVVVVVGVSGAMLGVHWLDAVAAIIVAMLLGRMGWRFMRHAVEELIDTGLPESTLRELEQLIDSVPGVRGHHRLRTRRMGGQAIMDVHILLDPDIRLSEANRIAVQVQQTLLQRIDVMTDVLVRIEPDDELAHAPAESLPPRETVQRDLEAAWSTITTLPRARRLMLHYRAAGVNVDVVVRTDELTLADDELARQLRDACRHLLYIRGVRLLLDTDRDWNPPKGR